MVSLAAGALTSDNEICGRVCEPVCTSGMSIVQAYSIV
jgi:hypothetical protein